MKSHLEVRFTTLVCDTDFLIKITNSPVPSLHGFMKESGINIATIPTVIKELKGLSNSADRLTAKRASNALSLIGSKVELLGDSGGNGGEEADTALIEFASDHSESALVCTLDGNLLSRLERLKLSYLTLRKDRPFIRSFHRAIYLSARKE